MAGAEIAIREESLPSDPYSIFDREDDALIVAELKGQVLDVCVYEFRQGGQQIVGISKRGVDECKRELAKKGEVLRVKAHDWRQEGEYGFFTVVSQRVAVSKDGREIILDEEIGTKRQWQKMKKRDGAIVPDPFWYEKGYAKAARNAYSALIPESLKQQIIKAAQESGKSKTLDSRNGRQAQSSSQQPTIQDKKWHIAEMILEMVEGDEDQAKRRLKSYLRKAGQTVPTGSVSLSALRAELVNAIYPYICEDYKQGGGDA